MHLTQSVLPSLEATLELRLLDAFSPPRLSLYNAYKYMLVSNPIRLFMHILKAGSI